jgi:hypothetical protein
MEDRDCGSVLGVMATWGCQGGISMDEKTDQVEEQRGKTIAVFGAQEITFQQGLPAPELESCQKITLS